MGIRLIALSAVFVGCSLQEVFFENDEYISGEAFYRERCVQCHGIDGKANLAGASDLSISNLNVEEMKDIVVNGLNAMPPFKGQYKQEETLEEMLEFIKSLRK